MAALIDRTRYEEITGTTVPENQHARVDALLEAVSDAIRDECGWHIAPVQTDALMTVDGSGGYIQNLPTLHLTAVSSVVEEGTAQTIGNGGVDWSERGQLSKGPRSPWSSLWTRKLRGVAATVTHGYAECPAAVALVLAAVVQRSLPTATTGAVPVGVQSETKGPFSITYTSPKDEPRGAAAGYLTAADKAALERYALPPSQGTGT